MTKLNLSFILIITGLITVAGSCKVQQHRPIKSYNYIKYVKPPIRNDGILTANPVEAGVDSALLGTLTKLIQCDTFPNIHSLLVMKDNRLIYERYFPGKDHRSNKNLGYIDHDIDSLHDCRSITKSVVSACIGIAISQRLIKSSNESIWQFFPEYQRFKTSRNAGITVRDLLTMSSGLCWNEYRSYASPFNSEIRMDISFNPIKFVLSRDMTALPAHTWNYNGGNTQLLAEIIRKVSGLSVEQFAVKNLFTPLGIEKYEWRKMVFDRNMPSAAAGLRLTSRDMLKIGSLYLNNGYWQNNPIIDSAWVKASLQTHVQRSSLKAIKPGGYGYQFWNYEEIINHQSYLISEAKGNGGNSIFICPQLQLVAVVTAGNYDNWKIKHNGYDALINYIMPAVMKGKRRLQ